MKRKTVIKWRWIDGRKQNPVDLDFHITPVITFSMAEECVENLGRAWGICLEWGHWAFGFGILTINHD